MQRLIFLNHHYKSLFDETKWSLDILAEDKIRKYLSYQDVCQITDLSKAMCEAGRPMYKLGFTNTDNDFSIKYLEEEDRLALEEELRSFENVYLDAYCPDEKTIVVWEVENPQSGHTEATYNLAYTNDMSGYSFANILKAMTRVMSYEKMLASKQFELAVLHTNLVNVN